ncbi:twin-arginine translocase TatA/TatE family subunit [Paenibacillus dakarensis]|uniref:twin-arginine translocase TatA/TatE family subunit n=1 Tax=Paenibacillus dakarensis TaxID=1527293 RepID=UPI0006D5AEB2|nr:twin-arginine translocase TatA/TatE family subunit [Paenibacillus dakarensis]
MPTIGVTGVILLVLLGLLLFGPKKLPELGRALGTTLRELKSGAAGVLNETEEGKSNKLPKETQS